MSDLEKRFRILKPRQLSDEVIQGIVDRVREDVKKAEVYAKRDTDSRC